MAARRYVNRHLDTVALLKTLGATRAFTLGVTVLQLAAQILDEPRQAPSSVPTMTEERV